MHLIYKQFRLYFNLYIKKKQHCFLLHSDDSYFIHTFKIKLSLFGNCKSDISFVL